MAETSWEDRIIQITNIIVYFLFLGSNVYAVAAPGVPGGKETYLTPAPWAFYIWSFIHTLFLGTIVYQFFPDGKATIIHAIRWRFSLLALINTIYVNLWARHLHILSFIAALFVSASVTHIYYVVRQHHSPQSTADEIFIHLPFSLYHGWTTVLVILSMFEAFGLDAAKTAPGVWTGVFVFLALFFLEGTAATYALSSPEGDLAASVAITWSLFAIFDQQKTPFIHWTTLTFAILSLLSVGKSAFGLWKRGRLNLDDAERAPLIA